MNAKINTLFILKSTKTNTKGLAPIYLRVTINSKRFEITFEFAKNGYEALQPYSQKSQLQQRLTGYCFDNLGAEQQIKHFGNDCNVMAEILISRYEQFVENNSITHITTNLSASEIENLYGNRLRSRMREMFNLVTFNSTSNDKR